MGVLDGVGKLFHTCMTGAYVTLGLDSIYLLHILIITHMMLMLSGLITIPMCMRWLVKELWLALYMNLMLDTWSGIIEFHILDWYYPFSTYT